MKIRISKKDIIWSYTGTIMSMGSNFVMLPFIIYYLSGNMLGLWYLFASIGGIATLFDFGFSVTLARNITYCWSGAKTLKKENVEFIHDRTTDFRLLKEILYTCKCIYFLIAILGYFLILLLGTPYILKISNGLNLSTVLLSWFIYATAVFMNLYYGYYISFLMGVGAVVEANKNTIIARIIQILLTLLLLFWGWGLLGVCVAYLTYGTLLRISGKYKFYKYKGIGDKLDQVKDKISILNVLSLFKLIWHSAWRDGIISICEYLCNQATTIICAAYLTLAETGAYSLGVQLAVAISTIASTLCLTYRSTLQEAYLNMNKKKMRKTISIMVMSYTYLFLLAVMAVSMFGLNFLRLIKPEAIIGLPFFLCMCLYQFMLKFRNCYTTYFSCTNRILYLRAFVISTLFGVILSIFTMKICRLGMFGLIISQIISQGIYNFWIWTYRTHKELEFNFFDLINIGTHEIISGISKGIGMRGKRE